MRNILRVIFTLLGLIVAVSLMSPWVTTTPTHWACSLVLWPAWVGALLFAGVASWEAVRFQDEPYFSTACWFGWGAITVALFGPAFSVSARLLTLLILVGWAGTAVGLRLELGREWPSDGSAEGAG